MYDSMVSIDVVDSLVDQYMAEDFVEHEAFPGMDNTRDTPRQLFKMLFTGFPDFRATVHELLQDGDKVVARVTFSGTHQGEFMGAPASGNRVEWSAIDILQFRDDKCVAHWGVMDMAGAMAQMGAAHS
jgi:steroid delta-isomerase-like uncharacterized protein